MDQYVHIGHGLVPLSIARQAADELLENPDWDGTVPEPEDVPGAPTAADNDAALADLMSKMGGLSG